jgi:hypothetical protein
LSYEDESYEQDATGEQKSRRDPKTDAAKSALRPFFAEHAERVFHEMQLLVTFERMFFHWITARALDELEAEGKIVSERQSLAGLVPIRIFRNPRYRYWRRDAAKLIGLVREYSQQPVTRAVGLQGELMFDAALPRFGFMPTAANVRSYRGRTWTETGHDLDRVFERDGVAYGTEIKNTLPYISRRELITKLRMCRYLGLRPLFIVRASPKSYNYEIIRMGGYVLIFGFQLYPFGLVELAQRVRLELRLPVDCPTSIQDGTIQRFLNWHQRTLDSGRVG